MVHNGKISIYLKYNIIFLFFFSILHYSKRKEKSQFKKNIYILINTHISGLFEPIFSVNTILFPLHNFHITFCTSISKVKYKNENKEKNQPTKLKCNFLTFLCVNLHIFSSKWRIWRIKNILSLNIIIYIT